MSELIDRAEAVERLLALTVYKSKRELIEAVEKSVSNENGWAGGVAECIDEIEDMPAAPRWHRVEEPPKEEGKYLVSDGRGNYFVVWWGPRLGWCYDPKFFCYWMPIEPPKEDA